jgi:signal transduction histidine kinase
VDAVPQDLGRVLLNLINNAFYAVTQKKRELPAVNTYEPTVTVATRLLPSGMAEIRIQDNGTGIPEHLKAKIFQPFFTTKPTGQGTGLGLSLAFDIITKGHNGTMELESADGMGTTFIIRLPKQTEEI